MQRAGVSAGDDSANGPGQAGVPHEAGMTRRGRSAAAMMPRGLSC